MIKVDIVSIPYGVGIVSAIYNKYRRLYNLLSVIIAHFSSVVYFLLQCDMLPPLKSYDFEVGASCSIAF